MKRKVHFLNTAINNMLLKRRKKDYANKVTPICMK